MENNIPSSSWRSITNWYQVNVRSRVDTLIQRTTGSHLFKTGLLTSLTVSAGILALKGVSGPAMAITIILAYATKKYIDANWKPLRNEARLAENLLHNFRGTYPWWNTLIDKRLVVGAMPLANYGHKEQLTAIGVTHTVLAVEPEELEPKLITVPVTHDPKATNWLQISTPDLHPVPANLIVQGASWMEEHLSKDSKAMVYVHCKSGKGRSVSIVIAFLATFGYKYCPTIKEMLAGVTDATEKAKIVLNYIKTQRTQCNMKEKALTTIIGAITIMDAKLKSPK